MPTNTRTVVFTDLANYTATVSGTDREGLRRILREHEDTVTPIVEKYRGRVVKNIGDSFMCLFPAATDALRASLDIQEFVTTAGGISIRLAMATGDVEELDGDAFGESVNLAARILSKTPAGEVWFALGTNISMNQSEIPWESVGRFRLKGLPTEQEAFRAVPRHKAWLPEAVTTAVKANNLVRIRRGARLPLLPPDPVVLLEGFVPGSKALTAAVDALPVINPASIYLAAYNISTSDRQEWLNMGRGVVVGTPEAIEAAVQDTLKAVSRTTGTDTIVLDMGSSADVELVMCGLALPAVPLSSVISAYSYDILPDGRWVNRSDRSVLRIEVSSEGVTLLALATGVTINGHAVPSGDKVKLVHGARIATPQGVHTFLQSNHGYAGMVIADTRMRLGVNEGQTAELGREPNHPGLAFPDRRGQENLSWCSGPRAARARTGGFTLDRALAGRRQASLVLNGSYMSLTPLHPRCPTYVVRRGSAEMERADSTVEVGLDDMVVAGTTIVGIRAPE
ncbi:MAG: adenylate/guanylate cyclase domain-containing protein [Deltaproteobacteria bacterium]|nr:adenylate/guanylate cyclase domain-containing protein [Deltaproteobacteria bacterium]